MVASGSQLTKLLPSVRGGAKGFGWTSVWSNPSMSSTAPLSGITVIEIGHSVAAPYAGMILGELGAEVIKVENPKGGDACRGWGPPFTEGTATAFHAFNRAKRGITIDLTDREQVATLRRLIRERADVVIHNQKYGTLDRYGLSAAALTAEKPSLVYCNIGAFGATGPLRNRPGYDPMMQACGGLMSLLGEDGRPPVRVTVSIIDMATAMWAVIGILAAVQERGRTGRGGIIDTSLYETTLAWMTLPISTYLANGEVPRRCGSGVEWIVPYQAFAAADGHIMVAAGNDNLFRRLCDAIGRRGLAEDPRFRTNSDRVINREALIPILEDLFATDTVAVWAERLDAAGIPNGPIQTVDQVVTDAQTAALGIVQQLRSISLVGLPLSFDGARPPLTKLGPELGEDNRDFFAPS
jgi:crotonobetainyl-CoA:carnitine CoA-transferase CaiB-like acyl-CoA transferase